MTNEHDNSHHWELYSDLYILTDPLEVFTPSKIPDIIVKMQQPLNKLLL